MPRRTLLTTALLLVLLPAAACGGSGVRVDALAPSDTRDTAGPYEVTVLISHPERVTSAKLHWYVGEGPAPAPLPLFRQDGSDRFAAYIPGQPAGVVVRWRVEVETDEGELLRVPEPTADDDAPTFSFEVAAGDSSG